MTILFDPGTAIELEVMPTFPGRVTANDGSIIFSNANGAYDFKVNPSSVAQLDSTGRLTLTQDPNPGARNMLTRFRSALAKTRAGTAFTRIAIITDSTGYFGTGIGTAAKLKSWPSIMGAQLTQALGIPSGIQSFWGSGYGHSLPSDDSRITLSGGWAPGLQSSVGGLMVATSTAGTLAWTPTVAFDTCNIYYVAYPGLSFTTNFDGGSNTTHGSLGDQSIQVLTLSVSLGTHTLNIGGVTAGVLSIVGVDCFTNSPPQISVWNWGWPGAATSDWAIAGTPSWFPLNIIPLFNPDLTIIDLGINDNPGIPIITYSANLQSIVNAAKASGGDVIIKTFLPSDTAVKTATSQQSYAAAARAVAAANGISIIETNGRWGSFAQQNALGLYSDSLHGSSPGYADVGISVGRALLHLIA